MSPQDRRRAVAFLLHQPGLSLLYGDRPPAPRVARNALAIGFTIAAMAAAWHLVPEHRWPLTIGIWAAGHSAWGVWLAGRQ